MGKEVPISISEDFGQKRVVTVLKRRRRDAFHECSGPLGAHHRLLLRRN